MRIVKYLRGTGAAVDPQSRLRWTPLLGAVFNGDIYLLRYLVENGADVNVRSVQGITPLWAAAFKGFKEKVPLLSFVIVNHLWDKERCLRLFIFS